MPGVVHSISIFFISGRGLLSQCIGVIDVLPFVCNMAASKVLSRLLGGKYVVLI